jgi:acetolactate synthase-1/2/3 large subunit
MNGAQALFETMVAGGVDTCFANPGTTEMQLVAALDDVPAIRPVLSLFEGVCTGAADGYGRITGRPALTVMHLGPGLANGLANLHNARRARTPLINLVGDHATWHRNADAPLTSDIVSLATPMSNWVREATSAQGLAADGAAAFTAALQPPGGIATLIIPQDCQWDPATGPASIAQPDAPSLASAGTIETTAQALQNSQTAVLLLGASALTEAGLRAAARVEAASNCRVYIETFAARREGGAGLPNFDRLPYFPEPAIEALADADTLVLAGALDPVSFFGYPDLPSRLAPETASLHLLAAPTDDAATALNAVADLLGAPSEVTPPLAERPSSPTGTLDVTSLGQALVAHLPENAIVVNEAATSAAGFDALSAAAPPHTVLGLTGGAIGQGLPTAVGAAVAAPDRQVLAFQADGSGMYTVQSLWTMAREALDVTVVIAANNAYRILQVELHRSGIDEPGPSARSLTDLGNPRLDWATIAQGFGLPASRVGSAEDLSAALERSFAEPGPSLIEAAL